VAERPDFAGVEITVNVSAFQLLQPLAVVDVAAGERAELGVVVFDDRLEDGRRPLLAFGAEGVAAFRDAPAVVSALLNLVDHLPQILTDLAAPQIASLLVEAVLPRLTQAVGPDLAAGALVLDEGVVLGDGITPVLLGAIDVDAQHL